MHKLKWCGKLAVQSTRDLIDNPSRMFEGEIPALAADLFLGNISSGHFENSLPRTLDQTI